MRTLIRVFLTILAGTCISGNTNNLYFNSLTLFAGQFHKEIATYVKYHNVILSPFSAHMAMSMAALGASDQTETEILDSLFLQNVIDVADPITKTLRQASATGNLNIVNEMFINRHGNISRNYKNEIQQIFGAKIEKVDFARNIESAAIINSWVSRQTKGNIKNIVQSDSLDGSTSAILVNAICFKGSWLNKFDESLTEIEDFHTAHGTTVRVEMMNQNSKFLYKESPELDSKIILLPYTGNMKMIVVLPNKRSGLSTVEAKLADGLFHHFQGMSERDVYLKLPKFTIISEIDLIGIFQNLGVHRAFTDYAQFTKILTNQNMCLSQVKQKAFIEVNEEGTTASAATGLSIGLRGGFDDDFVYFEADHPFYFSVINSDALILFSGHKVR